MTLPYTTPELSHERSDSDIALVESVTPHNYHPLPVVVADGRGRLGHRRRRAALPGLPRRRTRR